MKIFLLISTLMMSLAAQSATIAIIDSGTDVLHKDLHPLIWVNPGEEEGNNVDDDENGFIDDLYGWNFAESNNKVIDYSYLGTLTADIRKYFQIQTKALYGTATEEEKAWTKAQMEKPDFVKSLKIYGNFMHGTHVAGIAAKESGGKVLSVKLIPTEIKLPGAEDAVEEKGLGLFIIKQGLALLAKEQTKAMIQIGEYIHKHKVDIANGSFGTGYKQAETIVSLVFPAILRRQATPEELAEVTKFFLDTLIKEGEHFTNAASETLFVFAAGNEGTDNDKFPFSPTNVNTPNVISVAATLGRSELAPFSNYGAEQVDVAAPGVGIESTVPGNKYLRVSGTSQAAPFVAGIASEIKDSNPNLGPTEN